jgi:hypothetical protein
LGGRQPGRRIGELSQRDGVARQWLWRGAGRIDEWAGYTQGVPGSGRTRERCTAANRIAGQHDSTAIGRVAPKTQLEPSVLSWRVSSGWPCIASGGMHLDGPALVVQRCLEQVGQCWLIVDVQKLDRSLSEDGLMGRC